ncbi:hypothetical protein [Streptomyces sp. NRRL S-1022]|uniref:hypothetical protein n=1 Tax=Streptomyces sp. NRRL S-1022 TaxID=1463880 RepID=UPI00131C1432|nr:hypothetical protein [Streptomyces sp. NRRL S-1022]
METTTDRACTALLALRRSIVAGECFPDWTVASPSGHLIGLIIETPYGGPRHRLKTAVRDQTVAAWVTAGWITLGAEEPLPEYEGSRPGLRWEPGRVGRRLVLTEAGRELAGWRPVEW